MTFTPWGLFVDLGAAAMLLLAGQWLRSRVSVVQRLFLPASVIGGLIGLALGPNGIGVLKLSDSFSTYPGILIALIFASSRVVHPEGVRPWDDAAGEASVGVDAAGRPADQCVSRIFDPLNPVCA